MTHEITFQQYLQKEDLGLAAWGGKECLRLEVLMDYSGPFSHPDAKPEVLGSAAIRWSVLSDEFGNGLHASSANTLPLAQAILTAFLYARILALDSLNRNELFQRVQDAIDLCVASDRWTWLHFEPWYLSIPRQITWPWAIEEWRGIEARRPTAFVELAPGRTMGTIKS